MSDDATLNVVIYFGAIMVIVGNAWNVFQIYERATRRCKKPEENEQWDATARLMVEKIYEHALDSPPKHDTVLAMLGDVSEVVMREDSEGRKLVYFPADYVRRLITELKLSIITHTQSASRSARSDTSGESV